MKLKKIDLFLEVKGTYRSVDIDANTSISFNYKQTDLDMPTKIRNSFSWVVLLPKTKTNHDIFDNIDRIDYFINENTINPLNRINFQLYINGDLYETGYIKLEKITKTHFEISLFGGLGDFFFLLSEVDLDGGIDMRLKSLDFGDFYNHTINIDTLYSYWNNATGGKPNNYYDYASGSEINETIFSYAMTYQGEYDSFDHAKYITNENILDSTVQDTKWVLLNNDLLVKTYVGESLNEHQMQINTTTYITGQYRSYYQKPLLKFRPFFNKVIEQAINNGWTVNLDNDFFNDNNPYWADLWMIGQNYNVGSDAKSFATYNIPSHYLVNNITLPIGNTTEQIRPITTSQTMILPAGSQYRITVNIPSIWLFAEKVNQGAGIMEKLYNLKIRPVAYIDGVEANSLYFKYRDGQQQETASLDEISVGAKQFSAISSNFVRYAFKGSDNDIYNQNLGDDYQINGVFTYDATSNTTDSVLTLMVGINGNTYWHTGNSNYEAGFSFYILSDGAVSIEKLDGNEVRSNYDITYSDIVKSEDTCFDFLTSYSKIFGLYYLKDPRSKTVTIMSRNAFYGDEDKIDWTHKIDYNKEFSVNPVPFDFKIGILKWNDLGTKYEESYYSKFNKEYGSLRFNTGSEHSKDEKNFLDGIIFDNCIVAQGYDKYYLGRDSLNTYKDNKTLPYLMDKDNSGVENGFILCFRNGSGSVFPNLFQISDDSSNMQILGFQWSSAYLKSTNSAYYPLISRSITSNNEQYSLNFGRPAIDYSGSETPSNNTQDGNETIYARYWREYLRDRFDVNMRKLTCYVLLNISDINNNDLFRKFIYINNTAWVLDSISGFNPLSHKPTKCTLIKVQDVSAYSSGQNISPVIETLTVNPGVINADETVRTVNITVTSSNDWTAVISDSWINMSPISGTAGDTTCQVTLQANSTGTTRTGNISFSINGINKFTLNISQESSIVPYINVIPQEQRNSNLNGFNSTLQVESNTGWEAFVLDTTPANVTIRKSDGMEGTEVPGLGNEQLTVIVGSINGVSTYRQIIIEVRFLNGSVGATSYIYQGSIG